MSPGSIRLVLPATSANLGPGFDTAGLAMDLSLTIEAEATTASGGQMLTIEATGRNADRCARTSNNLIFETYRDLLAHAGRSVTPLNLRIHNEIPLSMGFGSSAAALLAGVYLANHFGQLGWDREQCMAEACRREGHPDNVAACVLGYLTVSTVVASPSGDTVVAATCGQTTPWKLLLALPSVSLATEKARALLPAQYSRSDVVANLQRTALLVSAFAQGRGDLLRVAMQDRLHQPYRMEACPLLPLLLPLAGETGIFGVALSGAGPAVLLVIESGSTDSVAAHIREAVSDPSLEVIETSITSGAKVTLLS
jgi:homoserine kinase